MTGYFEAVPVPPDGYAPGEFISSPPLEAVSEAKAFALEQAVSLAPAIVAQGNTTSPDEVLAWAKEFEAYLTAPPSKED